MLKLVLTEHCVLTTAMPVAPCPPVLMLTAVGCPALGKGLGDSGAGEGLGEGEGVKSPEGTTTGLKKPLLSSTACQQHHNHYATLHVVPHCTVHGICPKLAIVLYLTQIHLEQLQPTSGKRFHVNHAVSCTLLALFTSAVLCNPLSPLPCARSWGALQGPFRNIVYICSLYITLVVCKASMAQSCSPSSHSDRLAAPLTGAALIRGASWTTGAGVAGRRGPRARRVRSRGHRASGCEGGGEGKREGGECELQQSTTCRSSARKGTAGQRLLLLSAIIGPRTQSRM